MDTRILLVGCGKMGGALLGGWLDQGIQGTNIHAIEPNENLWQDIAGPFIEQGVTFNAALDELGADFEPDFVLFAVKPQMADEVVPAYKKYAGSATFISIAAGKTIAFFESNLSSEAAIIRTMPNTPAAVRRGISIACGNANVSEAAKSTCLELLTAVGAASWIDDESLIDAVTAVSGSGPAYVFLLAETMTQAGIEAGLSPEIASLLAVHTVAGSGELLVQSDSDAETLRKNVSSPGGTTEAALSILIGENGMQELMSKAIAKAVERSKELAG
ncbi:MAG: pyrroline-5-carboxylate reductase [Rhodospirillales bacterium]|nr:pyrroline-5-carboxylate reductase [Rhodospirillales bacterium]